MTMAQPNRVIVSGLEWTVTKKMQSFVKYPPRKLQSTTYSGPITLTQYERFQHVRKQLNKDGFKLSLPTGN